MKLALIGPELEENLALRYIHSSVTVAGHEAAIFDFHTAEQIDELAGRIAAWQPDVVGMSMVFTSRAREFVALAQRLRAIGYAGHITAGGHFAAFHAAELLRDFPAFDSIVHGEGEETVVELLNCLAAGPQARACEGSTLPGVSLRDAAGNVIIASPRQNIADLDQRPWPTRPETFHDYLGLPIANMLSSRGCYANCHFCSISAWHRQCGGGPALRFRQRSAGDVAREMASLYHDRGVRIFNFHDDNFFLPDRKAMLERINAIGNGLRFSGVGRIAIQAKARPTDIHRDTIAALKRIGLFRLFLGVENASVDGLRHLGRGVNREHNHAALRLLARENIHVCFNLLIFEPQCSAADLLENCDFMRRYAAFPLNFCRTEVYAGTELERRLREQGRLLGNYFGLHYRIFDERMQRAFELFREVFTPRNFTADGTNHEAMRLDYYYHILNHFWPDRVRGLKAKVKAATAELNRNNADLLEQIVRFAVNTSSDARTFGPAAKQECDLIAELIADRDAADGRMRSRAAELLTEMTRRAAGPVRPSWLATATTRAVKAAAAAGLLISTAAASPGTDPAPKPVTDPAPRPGDSKLNSPATRGEGRGERTVNLLDGPELIPMLPHHSEMAPGPIPPVQPPASQPTSQPTSQPEQSTIDRKDLLMVQSNLAAIRTFNWDRQAKAAGLTGKKATVRLEIELVDGPRGVKLAKVKSATVTFEPGAKADALATSMKQQIERFSFRNFARGGVAVVTVQFEEPKTHMMERAPVPIQPLPHPAPMERVPVPQIEEQSFDAGQAEVVLLADPPKNEDVRIPPEVIRKLRGPHMMEMVATPPVESPTSQPASAPPTSQPDLGPALPESQARKVEEYLNGDGMQQLYPVAVKRASLSKTVMVTVLVDKTGWVKKAVVKLPQDAPYLELKKELEEAIVGIDIPDISQAGQATVSVKLAAPKLRGRPDIHMLEMIQGPLE